MAELPFPLLETKFHQPRLRPDTIARPRLDRILGSADKPGLILLSAPPGYGKTTAILSWLESRQSPFAWLSLDQRDNELFLFTCYLVAAVRQVNPQACEESLGLLRSNQPLPQAALTLALVNELNLLQPPCLLCLEDYHFIQEPAIHHLVTELVEQQPRGLRLALITRRDPPLPLARWRSRQLLTEVRAAELRFTPQETAEFLNQQKGLELPPDILAGLEQANEGWITGLHLAGLALQQPGDAESFLASFQRSSHPLVRQYLLDEALDQQPPWLQDFLLRISILQRLCAEICQVLVEPDPEIPADLFTPPQQPAETVLVTISQVNLFLTALDDQGEWFRLHPLFAELLHRSLIQRCQIYPAKEVIAVLHRKASLWFEAQGLVDEALQHALFATDTDLAASIVERQFFRAQDLEQRQIARHWLEQLPVKVIQERPALLLAQAWEYDHQKDYALIPRTLEQAQRLLEQSGQLPDEVRQLALDGHIAALWSQHWYLQGQVKRSIEQASRALALLPPGQIYARSQAVFYLGIGLQMSGQDEMAEQVLQQALEEAPGKVSAFTLHTMFARCANLRTLGDLPRLFANARQMLQQSEQAGMPAMSGWAHAFLGYVHYQWNALSAAEADYRQGAYLAYQAHPVAVAEALAGLALTLQAQGKHVQAWECVEQLAEFEHTLLRDPDEPRALQARLSLLQGDLDAALNWSLSLRSPARSNLLVFYEVPNMTQARIRLAEGSPSSLAAAARQLDALLNEAQAAHATFREIEILALQAICAWQNGRPVQALSRLEQALRLSQPGGFLRLYLDLGELLGEMVEKLATRPGLGIEDLRPYLERLLEAFQKDPAHPQTTIMSHLTRREIEVLRLLEQRLSDQEIAERLGLSAGSVRQYTHRIYQKLNVSDRRQAAAMARKLGMR
jgi:LuxR family maltose regulon positive regulatory protein